MRKFFVLLLVVFSVHTNAQSDIKIMFYNLLHYPSAPPSNRNVILKNILNTYEPDLFMVCELEDENGANTILNTSLSEINKNYAKALYTNNQSSNRSILEQLVFYNTDYFILNSQDIILTTLRDINHYTFVLKTTDYLTNPIYLEVFITHLKANQGSENERLDMAEKFTATLENLNPNSFVIFAGDLNLYTSSEPAYQEILNNNNNIVIKDILNLNNTLQNWHNNVTWINSFTQSTRISNAGFDGEGAGGGFDDRFDFIMISENMLSNTDIQYKPNSYQNYGNNGNSNCLNSRIDASNCTGSKYSQSLRTDLYNMSDHLPVTLELETSKTLYVDSKNNIKKDIVFLNGNLIKNEVSIGINEVFINKKITIYTLLGQTVFSSKINSQKLTINTSYLSANMYFIYIEGYNKVLKFIKY